MRLKPVTLVVTFALGLPRIRSKEETTMRLKPVTLVVTFALGLLVGPLPAEAQQAGKVYRIGFLGSRSARPYETAFRQQLRELGYVEGQNVVIEDRYAGFKGPLGKLAAKQAAELVRIKVDVIVTSPAPPVIGAAQRTTRTIPIVMVGADVDPVDAGFIVSLARPGGNITGLTNLPSKLHSKRLELLKEAVPRISRVVILWNPSVWNSSQKETVVKKVEAMGEALGIQIRSLVARRDIESVFSAIGGEHPDGLLVVSSGRTIRHRARLADFAVNKRLPTIYDNRIFMNSGGLMVYDADRRHLHRRAATYVDKILKGTKPGELPVEQPTKFVFEVNLKTAKQLGITIPPEVLYQATKVIK
jgi:putative ABC transport system substrate-binding protein